MPSKADVRQDANSSLYFVKESILEFFTSRQSATQEEVLRNVNWPSVLVSTCLGFLIEDGHLLSRMENGRVILEKPSFS